MAKHRTATTDEGDILNREQDDKGPSYKDFQAKLDKYKDMEDQIIDNIPKSVAENNMHMRFKELVDNFKGKDSLIRRYMVRLEEEQRKLTAGNNQRKSYETELNKLEVSKLNTFMWLLQQELKREELNKQEVLKVFMAQCVNNDLAVKTTD